jgi:hypothetical protein
VAKSTKKALLQSKVLRVCLCHEFALHEIKGQASRWDPRRASPWLIFALGKKEINGAQMVATARLGDQISF